MVTVAIAGGTGKLGRTIAKALKAGNKHQVIILSRQTSSQLDIGCPVLPVDYTDAQGLKAQLEAKSVHTIISTLQVNSAESGACEINLVRAASQSRTTKRFIASEWSIPVPDPRLYLPQQEIRNATIEELCGTDLEWTTVYNGFIMDSFGIPHIKSYMGPIGIHIDMSNKTASIPGSGDEKMMFTYSVDIARFVEAALDLPKWDDQLFCYGDIRTYNEVLQLAEENIGAKFHVVHDDIEKLEKGNMTELPCHQMVYSRIPKAAAQRRFSLFGLYSIRGYFNNPENKGTLNDIFPYIKTSSVADIMGAWKGKN
ncbi:hypothetical protein N7478_007235 [Penicillium angulare]|uniref:uncharacterized protein n=1 Tax=Penicillium angulare TaxID=116970 RepID=UPI00253F7CAF|nr:uncharacterized protein N7478_007235 [Penicillium angulare]KAJ5281863.1 hypothetical protein N7478_007235 [Penicillium angulare]